MRTETTSNYARVLYELAIPEESITETERIFQENKGLHEVFCSPLIQENKKHKIIDRIFPKDMRNFLKVACDHQKIGEITAILEVYREYAGKKKGIIHAVVTCVVPPDETRQEQLRAILRSRYGAEQAELEIKEDPSLLGGFLLSVSDEEFDWSLRGRLKRLDRQLRVGTAAQK